MSDITACNDKDCPIKDKCYRYTCNKDELCQSYFIDSPRENKECKYFLKLNK